MYIIENNEYKNIEKTICPDCGVLYSYEHRLFHKHKGRQTEYIINIKCILNNTTNWINHSIAWDSTASWIVNMIGGGIYNYSESITGIGFFWTAGTFADGEIKIYGFK